MNKGAGEGKLPEVSPELTELRTIVRIREQDLEEAIVKMEKKRKESVEKLERWRKNPPPEVGHHELVNVFLEFVPYINLVEKAAVKLLVALKKLAGWYERSIVSLSLGVKF